MIGWYVHHHGRGHLTRARAVAARLAEPVVGLSSLPDPGGFADWVQLPGDLVPAGADPTAGGALHWAPPGVAPRMAALTGWVAAARPRAVVVDVSVEATLAARLCGVPVVVVAQPGERGDDAHQLAYRVADRILAFWPRAAYDPPWLARWAPAVRYLGAMSRYDGRAVCGRPGTGVVVLDGAGGSGLGTLDPSWRLVGGRSWSEDPWPALRGAEVVVTHAGQNALAEVAAARRPAVVVPAERPFGEQRATAAALERAGLAVVAWRWPTAGQWPGLLAAARARGGEGWSAWSPGDAAARAAAEIAAL